ncbi:ATP-dependent helicase [Flindersiella endophytica]
MPSPAYRLVRRPVSKTPAPALDAAQQEVVKHRGGPLLVLAGPGTGKTTTLVESIIDRVQSDGIDPSRILALTFGRRAAVELRDRIAARLDRTIRDPVARTFHSYAFGLLRKEAVLRGTPQPRLLSGPEQDLLIRDLLRGDIEEFQARAWPPRLHPALATRGFSEELRDLLLRAAERGIDPPTLRQLGRRHKRDDWVAAATFADQYAAVTALRPEAPAYDPAELVRAAVDLLRADREILAQERASRAVVFVDEYQDADPAQEELLRLLAGDGSELVAVGDPDQSIYAFRGAEVDVIRRFPERFRQADGAEAPTVALRTCRRSGKTLLEASRRVAGRLGGPPKHRRLEPAQHVPDGELEVHLLRSANSEAAYVAQRLRKAHLVDGIPWQRMAVLVRAATQLPVVRRALATAGVPAAIRLEEMPLVDQPAVRPLLTVLELISGRRELDPQTAIDLLASPYGGADALALRRLRQELRREEFAAGGSRGSDALLVGALGDLEELDGLDLDAVAPAARVARLLAAAHEAKDAPKSTAETILWAIWSESRVAERWAMLAASGAPGSAAADRDLDAVTALFDTVARFVDRMPYSGPDGFLDHLLGQEIPADTLAPRAPEGDAVALLTAHAAKGLEWDVVAVVGVQDGAWPDLRMRGSLLGSEFLVDVLAGRHSEDRRVGGMEAISRALAEERRLFYVAVTRARRTLLVTAIRDEEDQPSRFLEELLPYAGDDEERPLTRVPRGLDLPAVVAELRSVVCSSGGDHAAAEREAAAHQLARLSAAGVRGADPGVWYALPPLSDDAPLRQPGELVSVSPSKVEAYHRCALRWLLEGSGGAGPSGLSLAIGTLIHGLAYDVATGRLSVDDLPDAFERHWPSLDAGRGWNARREHDRVRDMVVRLAGWLRSNPRELVVAEHSFLVTIGRARLKGTVDRIDRGPDGELIVIDYKTGKSPVPRADLERHPQLGVYQLALEHGAFRQVVPPGTKSGGAMLVQLGKDGKRAAEQAQQPLSSSDDPAWAERLVDEAAEGMAGTEFGAKKNKYCTICPVRRSCPLHAEGAQVTP